MEMKSLNHRFNMAAAESDKDSGYSGLENYYVTFFCCYLPQTLLLLMLFDKSDSGSYSLCLLTWGAFVCRTGCICKHPTIKRFWSRALCSYKVHHVNLSGVVI